MLLTEKGEEMLFVSGTIERWLLRLFGTGESEPHRLRLP